MGFPFHWYVGGLNCDYDNNNKYALGFMCIYQWMVFDLGAEQFMQRSVGKFLSFYKTNGA